MARVILSLVLLWRAAGVSGLDNGLALTPPMGWLSWERFECNTDCMDDPDNCIGEKLIMSIADVMAKEGYRDAGYEYIAIDDCWPADKRDSQGRLQPDPRRFPSGMKALADYIHARGLKFGLYEDVGRHTCAGAPGSQGHLQIDAQTFADWGVDMLKFDGCNAESSYYAVGYPDMGKYLNQTGRQILYYCEWLIYGKDKPTYEKVAETCNMFRVYGDIYDAWQSIYTIINFYGGDDKNFSTVAKPGSWNDADQIVVGNYGLSYDEERGQMGMWAMMASPLLMSVDLRKIRQEAKDLLQNKRVLSISQDSLGIQGTRKMKWGNHDQFQVWTRPVTPKGSFAIAYLNIHNQGYPMKFSIRLSDIGLTNEHGYSISEVFDGEHIGTFKPSDNFTARVNPSGIVLARATILTQQRNVNEIGNTFLP